MAQAQVAFLKAALLAHRPVSRPRTTRLVSSRAGVPARAAEVSRVVASTEHEGQSQNQPGPPEDFSVDLPTADVQASVRLMGVRQGRGAAIVVCAVEPGSAAAAAGLRPGQQLLAVSDPMRRTDMWQLDGNSSLRYTRQAIRMRVAEDITLSLTRQPVPEWAQVVAAQRAPAAAEQQQPQQGLAAAQPSPTAAGGASSQDPAEREQEVTDDLLSAVVRLAEAERSGSTFDEGDPSPSGAASTDGDVGAGPAGGQPLTVAERLQAEYAARQQAEAEAGSAVQRQLTDLERRQKRRKEYFEQAGQRNDGPFFAAVAALFILPPAIILGVAFATGFMDTLDVYSLLR